MKTLATLSADSTSIAYSYSGAGETALLFIHGWLGNKTWWNEQLEFFKEDYLVAAMDLGGHGDSAQRKVYSSKTYAEDIAAVANALTAKKVILVGHSMSGAYVLEAAKLVPKLSSLIVIDNLKDLDFTFTEEQISQFMDLYKNNFKYGMEAIFPQYLFTDSTPKEVRARLTKEFLSQEQIAMEVIEPLYRMDLKLAAKSVDVPVRAINSDNSPTNLEANRKYFKDYDFKLIKGTGHYPMLEKPREFNNTLDSLIR